MGKSSIFDLKQILQFDQMMVTNFFGSPCIIQTNTENNLDNIHGEDAVAYNE